MSEQLDQQTTNIDLTAQDLYNIRELINVAAQRGAYRAVEFKEVGAVYDRLNTVVASLFPQPPVLETTEQQAEPTAE